MSERIYNLMVGTFLSLFIVIVGGTAAWRYYVNQQVGHAVKAILGALAIMVFTFWFYEDTAGNISQLNEWGADIEGIASSANVLMTSENFDANEAYDSQEGVAVLQNQMFNLMVKRPYLLLNYGTTKESEITAENPNRVDELLSIKPYDKEGKVQRGDLVEKEVSDYDNKQMSPEFSGERFGYLIITIISTVALSIPIILLASFKFLLQVWFLALVIFTAIPLVISLIPSYSETALNHFKKVIGVLLMKGGLVLLIAVITGLITLLYETVKVTNGIEGYTFVVFMIVLVIWGLMKYRSEIFEVASAGMIQGQQVAERMTYATTSSIGEAGEKGFQGAKRMTAGAFKLGGKTREFLSNRNSNEQKNTASPSKSGIGLSLASGQRSAKRDLSEQGQQGNSAVNQAIRRGTATKSASRNADIGLVKLDDYKKGKGEVSTDGDASVPNSKPLGQVNRNPNRSVSRARNPHVNTQSAENKDQGAVNPSSQRTGQSSRPQNQPSPHRNPVGRMESQRETAAAREPSKPITQWEAQQQINARKATTSSEHVGRSESREPKAKEPEKRPKRMENEEE